MYEIELSSEYANQEFSLQIDEIENIIDILLQTTPAGTLLMTVSLNDTALTAPVVCVPNKPLLTQNYITNQIGGNFVFYSENNIYPSYENFGTKCNLYFLTNEEMTELTANAQ